MDSVKKYTCKVCKSKFVKAKQMQVVCSLPCALGLSAKNKDKNNKKVILADKKAVKAKLEALKTKPQLTKELQKVFNAYIRQRDYGNDCISCESSIQWGLNSTGGVCDAGHYLSVGSRVNLRFNEDNVHAQCKHCNNFLAGNASGYRVGLIKKIGLERVEALESDSIVNKYTHEQLRQMIDFYKQKTGELKNGAR